MPIRVTGIWFTHNTYTDADWRTIIVSKTNTMMRIDRCRFDYGKRVLNFTRRVWGVVDRCHFVDNLLIFANRMRNESGETCEGDSEWAAGNRFGKTNTLVIEDNFIQQGVNTTTTPYSMVYGEAAASYMVRHNYFAISNVGQAQFDAHGWPNACDWGRGSHNYEVYSNRFHYVNMNDLYRVMYFRGGEHICYSNAFTTGAAVVGAHEWELVDESEPSAKDFHTNSFYYANTWNGAAFEPSPNSAQVVEDVSYFLRAPQSGDNLFPYTQLAYPHPMITAQDGGGPAAGTRATAVGRVNFGGRVKMTAQ